MWNYQFEIDSPIEGEIIYQALNAQGFSSEPLRMLSNYRFWPVSFDDKCFSGNLGVSAFYGKRVKFVDLPEIILEFRNYTSFKFEFSNGHKVSFDNGKLNTPIGEFSVDAIRKLLEFEGKFEEFLKTIKQ